jgi:hypothetical protein
MKALVRKLTAPARLVCIGCGGQQGVCELAAQHSLNPPAATLPALPSRGLLNFLRLHDGAIFFHMPAILQDPRESGLQLYAAATIASETRHTLARLHEGLAVHPGLPAATAAALAAWVEQLLVIGQPLGSGDRIALDPSDSLGGEARVIFLDHEHYSAGLTGPDHIENAWDSFEEFLGDFADVPEEFLAASWRVSHPFSGEPCFLQRVEYLPA